MNEEQESTIKATDEVFLGAPIKEPDGSVRISGWIVAETDKAVCLDCVNADKEQERMWFPLSQVNKIERSPRTVANRVGVQITKAAEHIQDALVVTAWIARKKGF